MPNNYLPSPEDYIRFLPEIILTVVGTLIMMLQPVLGARAERLWSKLSIAALVGSIAAAAFAYEHAGFAFQNMLVIDGFATFFRILVIVVGLLVVFSSSQYLRKEHAESA